MEVEEIPPSSSIGVKTSSIVQKIFVTSVFIELICVRSKLHQRLQCVFIYSWGLSRGAGVYLYIFRLDKGLFKRRSGIGELDV